VTLIAILSCGPTAGGPISEFPVADPRPGFQDAGSSAPGGRGPNDEEEADAQDAAVYEPGSLDAGAATGGTPPCLADAGGVADADTGVVADAADGSASDASDAAPDAGDAAQIEVDANFPDASADVMVAPEDASSDAPYSSADAGPCIP
jgi:hypothetical protein